MGEGEDRRVRRTKRMLRQALVELMQEKEFKDITVTDLVARADINRGTFYVHYRDVYDLRERIEDEMIGTFRAMLAGGVQMRSLRPLLVQAVDYLEENRELVCSLLSASGADCLQSKLMQIVEDYRLALCAAPNQQDYYVARFLSAGVIALLEKWLGDAERMPRGQVIDMLDGLLEGRLTKIN